MNYNELKQTIHDTATAKGWYEKARSTNELLLLIKSELFESLEAYRVGKFATINEFTTITDNTSVFIKSAMFKPMFKELIKDSVEDEISDVVIRTLDMAAYLELDIPQTRPIALLKDYPSIVRGLDTLLGGFYDEQMTGDKVCIILSYCEGIADVYDFDLDAHVLLKMAYNATREYRHGNKKI